MTYQELENTLIQNKITRIKIIDWANLKYAIKRENGIFFLKRKPGILYDWNMKYSQKYTIISKK